MATFENAHLVTLQQGLTPKWFGKKIDINFSSAVKKTLGFIKFQKEIAKQPPFFKELEHLGLGQGFVDWYNSPDAVRAEVSSVNIRGNARGCAKLASIMANKGGYHRFTTACLLAHVFASKHVC